MAETARLSVVASGCSDSFGEGVSDELGEFADAVGERRGVEPELLGSYGPGVAIRVEAVVAVELHREPQARFVSPVRERGGDVVERCESRVGGR
jgi:hypothetical protein